MYPNRLIMHYFAITIEIQQKWPNARSLTWWQFQLLIFHLCIVTEMIFALLLFGAAVYLFYYYN